nr:ARM repeat superfamily protein [Ipomoea batatas]
MERVGGDAELEKPGGMKKIRLSAAEILSKLAGKKQNALRVAAIPGAMESISSLLQINRSLFFSRFLTLTRSLQLLKMLAGTTGSMGKELRQQISEVVLNHQQHQRYTPSGCIGEEMEPQAESSITSSTFFLKLQTRNKRLNHVRNAAGEALAMLLLRSLVPAGATVLKGIWSEQEKLQEMMIGLAAQYPSVKVPRMRRFVIELAIWMMRDDKTSSAVEVLRNLGMERRLEFVMETTSRAGETLMFFSGTVGDESMPSKLCTRCFHTAINLLARRSN